MEKFLVLKISNKNISKKQNFEKKYWSEIALIHLQTEGLLFGYNFQAPKEQKMLMRDIYFINADGQIPELLSLFKDSTHFEYFRYKEKEKINVLNRLFKKYNTKNIDYVWEKLMATSHCSAFFKILRNPDNSIKDVLLAHSTWDDYSAMIRIFKQYFLHKIKKKS